MTNDIAAQDDVAPGACGDVDPERAGSAKFDALVDMLRHADTSTTGFMLSHQQDARETG